MPTPITIYSRIATLATSIAATFEYGRKSDINIIADNSNFPAICLIEPDDTGFVFDTLTEDLKDTESVFIQFLDLCEMGDQAINRIDKVQAMKTMAAKFINLIVNDEYLSLTTVNGLVNLRGTLVVDTYDANTVGIEINIPLQLIYPRGCDDDNISE